MATAENSKYDEGVLEYKYWQVLLFTHENLLHYWINIKMWASSKQNSDALVFTNRNIGYFSIVCFHECKILTDFAIICFRQNTQFNEILYVLFAVENDRNTFDKIMARSNHKILDNVQVLSSNSKILRKVWVECLITFSNNFPKVFARISFYEESLN